MLEKSLGKILERLASFTPSRYLFRVVIAALVTIILVSQFPWTEKLLGRILNFPDLRHHISLGVSKEVGLDTARLTVVNLGFGIAENVLIHVSVRRGDIVGYQIDSQELYEMKTDDLENGMLDISLDRLASGASVYIELTGTEFVTNTVLLSAVSDQGSSTTTESPSFSGQVDTYTTRMTVLFRKAGGNIWEAPSIREIRSKASGKPVFRIVESQEFRTVGLAALIVIFLIVVFLPEGFWLIIPFITGLFVWLFFNLYIPTWWTVAVITIALLLTTALTEGIGGGVKIPALLGISAIGGFFVWWYWYDTMSINWILGLMTSFLTFIIILLMSG